MPFNQLNKYFFFSIQPKYEIDDTFFQKGFKIGDWTLETGYKSANVLFPQRISSAHSKLTYSFWLVLNNTDLDFKCKSSQGFKVIHTTQSYC
jgi:hypothetical protein